MGTDEVEDAKKRFRILQVSNISPAATKDQVQQLFGYLGRIADFRLYPSDPNGDWAKQIGHKFAYVQYEDRKSVEVAQHLTNTVLVDRALVCIPSIYESLPTEDSVKALGGPSLPGQRALPAHLQQRVQDLGDGTSVLLTVDPRLTELGLPQYPPLSADMDAAKVEEIRRTVYVGNLPKTVNGDEFVTFFNDHIGEVMYARLTSGGPAALPCAYAYIEFSQQSSVPMALQNSGALEFAGRVLRIQHSRVAIVKPQQKTSDQALEEIEDAIRRQAGGTVANTRECNQLAASGRRPRTPSPSRRRARSGSKDSGTRRSATTSSSAAATRRRSRSRSKSRRRSRSRSRRRDRSDSRDRRRRRSRSRSKRRSRSRDRKRDRSRSRDKGRSRHRSRSKTPKKSTRRSRSKDKKRDRSASKDRDRKRSKKSVEKERDGGKDKKKSGSGGTTTAPAPAAPAPPPAAATAAAKVEKKRSRSSSSSSSGASSASSASSAPASEKKKSTKEVKKETTGGDEELAEEDEAKLRERLLERAAARKGTNESSTGSPVESKSDAKMEVDDDE